MRKLGYKYTSLTEYDRLSDVALIGAEEESSFDQLKWVTPRYGSGRVDAAGKIIAERRPVSTLSMDEALTIAGNWRSSHAYPLHVMSGILRSRAKQVDASAIVVQRLKRIPSIVAKLKRFPTMQLSQMQDLGGCRAIVTSLQHVAQLVSRYERLPTASAKFHYKHDYIAKPKADGYRGVHLVYEYQSGTAERALYGGKRVEIQIRSALQHVWATAVETIDTYTNQSLKSGIGSESWKMFFSLMSTFMGSFEHDRDGYPQEEAVRLTPTSMVKSLDALRTISRRLEVDATFVQLALATRQIHTDLPNISPLQSYILVLTAEDDDTEIIGFSNNVAASEVYIKLEKKYLNDPSKQLVLVSGDSVLALRKAYPNYFSDLATFIGFVQAIDTSYDEIMNELEVFRRQFSTEAESPA